MHNKTLFLHSAPYLSSVFTNLSRHTTTCGQKLGESQMESFKEECGNQSVLDVIGRSVPSSPSLSQTTPISPHPALLRPISTMYWLVHRTFEAGWKLSNTSHSVLHAQSSALTHMSKTQTTLSLSLLHSYLIFALLGALIFTSLYALVVV